MFLLNIYVYECSIISTLLLDVLLNENGSVYGLTWANIIEANGAISKADFSSKMSIAYKECLETKYWLHLLKDSGDLEEV